MALVLLTGGGTPFTPRMHLHCVALYRAARRRRIQSVLGADESPLSIVAFPLLGVGDFTYPSTEPGVPHAAAAAVVAP